MLDIDVYVLHVREGYDDRAKRMQDMMSKRNLSFSYILEGDISDLTEDVLNKYFVGEMHKRSAATSCAMKHLYACEAIVSRNIDGALVLEDDIILYDNFERVFNACMTELRNRDLKRAIISFEDSSLKFVGRSEIQKGMHLYKKHRDRFAGALYYSREAAQKILEYVALNRCCMPIDLMHTEMVQMNLIDYYWCHPCVATQGSHTGICASSIDGKSAKKAYYRRLTWKIKLLYKKLLYSLR